MDIILKDKAAKAREKGIDFSAQLDLHGSDFLDPLDLSTLFGNALDNAIEACEKLEKFLRENSTAVLDWCSAMQRKLKREMPV